MLWYGLAQRPDNNATISSFEEMREWRTVGAESDDWQSCSVVEFGSDPMPGVDKQCFCEVQPAYEARKCADEGDECICNGHVYFAPRFEFDNTTPANFAYIQENPFAVADTNNTGTMTCTSDSFEGADPSPDTAKECFCDDKRYFLRQPDFLNIQEYWRDSMMVSQTDVEIQQVISASAEAEAADEATGTSDDELARQDDDGDADLIAAGCKLCDETCSADSTTSLTKEIEKQKDVIKKKYEKKKLVNKQKKGHAHNKRIAGDQACNAAQKSKDPSEKKKQKRLCKDLKEEASKIETEAKVEEQNINDQQQSEEKEVADDNAAAIKEQTEKSNVNKKSQEINRAKLKEQKAARITKEAEERIAVIK
jgi:hypothetical protein